MDDLFNLNTLATKTKCSEVVSKQRTVMKIFAHLYKFPCDSF